MTETITPFRSEVPEAVLTDLREPLSRTRFPIRPAMAAIRVTHSTS